MKNIKYSLFLSLSLSLLGMKKGQERWREAEEIKRGYRFGMRNAEGREEVERGLG